MSNWAKFTSGMYAGALVAVACLLFVVMWHGAHAQPPAAMESPVRIMVAPRAITIWADPKKVSTQVNKLSGEMEITIDTAPKPPVP